MSDNETKEITQVLNDMKEAFDIQVKKQALRDEKHDKHITQMQPILDAYNGAGVFATFVIWLSKMVVAMGIVAGGLYSFIHFK